MNRWLFRIVAAAIGCLAGLAALFAQSAAPQRIVAAGGDLAEIAFALGAGERIVAVDRTATFPPEAARKPRVGYVRELSAEGVLSMAPDLVLAAHDAGPPVVLDQIAAAGVRVARAPETVAVEDIPAKIRFVGRVLGRRAEADALVARFEAELAAVRAKVAELPRRPRVLFVLSAQQGAPIVAGAGTTADSMIRLAGAENAATGFEDYKPMSREAILAAAPEIVLMMDQHAARAGGIETLLARPEIRATPAGRDGRAVTMEGMLLLGFGPRTPQAIAELARLVHPADAAAAGL